MTLRRYQPIVEALVLLAVTFVLAVRWHLPTLWLLVPFTLITVTRRDYATYGLTLQRGRVRLGSVAFHVALIVGIFLPYMLCHYALAHWWFGARFRLRLPPELWQSAFNQIVVIALPEEFFFRGYLQTQCDQVWGRPYRVLGAQCGIGLVVAAALFALCHLTLGIGGLTRFLPGLWYGWLRARSETVALPVAYHAASNLLMQLMVTSLSA